MNRISGAIAYKIIRRYRKRHRNAVRYKINQSCFVIVVCIFLITTLFLTKLYKNLYHIKEYVNPEMKHILLWTSPDTEPFKFIGLGQQGFIKRNCPYTNCFVTAAAKNYFGDSRKYHAVIFTMSEVVHYHATNMPQLRYPHQKFVFSSIESSQYYPACSDRFNGFFNWTWSFRLDSDCRWEYIAIRDVHNNVIGPNKIMNWIKVNEMRPVSDELRKNLQTKTKAAAWFASSCESLSMREVFVKELQNELAKYNHTIDIYGKCGNLTCLYEEERCMKLIKSDYYFYLAFENSFSEDYVTEKLLHALKNNAVPVVYGAANYTRFMPDGIYLNAIILGPEKLAREMNILIKDSNKYADFFRWKNHYSYHKRSESEETNDYCAFCKLLNDKTKFNKVSVISNFRKWWDGPDICPENIMKGDLSYVKSNVSYFPLKF